MSIYRGSGGSGDANTDATINEVTELVQDALGYKNEAATSASNAATSASNAATSESNASTSETNASSSASDAATSETNAATSETNAATSATSASTSATSASTSATAAQTAQTAAETAQASAETAETNASASATSATNSASTATTQAGIATTKASEASTSATNAATSETNAANSATSASTSATNAANSASTASTAASNAATSESNASTSETNAAASATSASSSASSASSSATSAAGSATTATTKASEASTSASNAATSATNAASSASSASTSATNAATSESNAGTSATNAASSASAAATSASEAAASAASIDTSSFVVKSNNLSDLDSASSALTNLGISNHDDITVDGSGKVGVGTSSPSQNLHISASTDTRIALENTSNRRYDLISGNSGEFRIFDTAVGERLRIDSSGDLLVGRTANTDNATLCVDQDASGGNIGISTITANATTRYHLLFRNSNGQVGAISTNGSSTSYNTSSDYRLKEDVQPMSGNIDRVKALNPVNFAWKVDGSRVDGFLAHEAQEVVPEAVHGTKDAMTTEEYEVTPAVLDDDGNVVTEAVMGEREVPDYQGIDQSKLVPLLTAALQEAIGRIEALESKLTTLSE